MDGRERKVEKKHKEKVMIILRSTICRERINNRKGGDNACVKKKAIFPDIKRRISKEKQKGLMKNNPLKPDDYIQQL